MRHCDSCDYFLGTCTGVWCGRKVETWYTCSGHSSGDDHLITVKIQTRDRFTSSDIEVIREMFTDGMSTQDIADQFYVGYNRVYNHIKDLAKDRKFGQNELADMTNIMGVT